MKPRLLVWLRRFRPSYEGRFRFHRALAEACSGLVYPVTIQDRSYRSSLIDGFTGRGWFIAPLAFLTAMAAMLVAVVPLAMASAPVETFLLVVIILYIATGWAAVRLTRRLGYRAYRGPDARLQVATDLDRVKQGRRAGGLGVEVMQCDDEVWQDVVREALLRADVVIIDVSELTEHLRWEIRQALDILSPERVIFARERESDGGGEAREAEMGARIASEAGIETQRRLQVVAYPARQAPPGPARRRQTRDLIQRLRVVIAEALVSDRERATRAMLQPRS
ncbi:MAG TPA: hypothetical protein VMM18_17275 [Gemmatimonadaceae bacterium]|nr:hypothetical protein [Gemmatimonadaceae bacterium]